MTIHHQDDRVTLHHGDALDVLRTLPDASVDAVVTDPPYGLGFMGKEWDQPGRAARATTTAIDAEQHNPYKQGRVEYGGASYGTGYVASLRVFQQWCEAWAAECLRVLKPGGHLLAFGGTRTWHRLACAVEEAGFEVRDSIAWLYGSGFPKSLDVSKAIDKAAQQRHQQDAIAARARGDHAAERRALDALALAEREVVGPSPFASRKPHGTWTGDVYGEEPTNGSGPRITAPATDAAREWAGWGTALKPAFEPVVVARKPLVGTVAANVTTHGTGALNIDGCRIGIGDEKPPTGSGVTISSVARAGGSMHGLGGNVTPPSGRWPANVILDEDMAAVLDEQSGTDTSRPQGRPSVGTVKPTDSTSFSGVNSGVGYTDTGGASRFFFVANREDNQWTSATTIGERSTSTATAGPSSAAPSATPGSLDARFMYAAKAPKKERPVVDGVAHPTVKPLALMRWLVRLVTPPGGTVLEPFAGSGTTVEACLLEGFQCIAIEKGDEYLPLIVERIRRQTEQVPELDEIVRTIDPEAEVVAQVRRLPVDVPLFDLDGGVTA